MGFSNTVRRKACKLLSAAACLSMGFVLQSPANAQSGNVYVVGSNVGGRLAVRATQVIAFRSSGQRVRITGSVCLSSCTMYLGAGNVCISPKTIFGFHGPSNYGAPLSQANFEYWSDVMASFYTPTLRDWYMQTARKSTSKMLRISGAQLIKMGYEQC